MKHLIELCMEFGITPELTASNTPQMNGVVERAFAVVKERSMAMLYNICYIYQQESIHISLPISAYFVGICVLGTNEPY